MKSTIEPAERAELIAELAAAKAELQTYRKTVNRAQLLAAQVIYGPSLAHALRAWDVAYMRSDRRLFIRKIPERETVAVAAAYIRRRAFAGILIALCALVAGVLPVLLLWQQNKKIDQQTELTAVAQSAQLQAELLSTSKDIFAARKATCLPDRVEIRELVDSKLSPLPNTLTPPKFGEVSCWNTASNLSEKDRLTWLRLLTANRDSTSEILRHFVVREVPTNPFFAGAVGYPELDEELHAKAAILSDALRPYRTLIASEQVNSAPELSNLVVSPERGALLKTFADAKFSARGINFSRAWSPGRDLTTTSLNAVDFSSAYLSCSTLTGSFSATNLAGIRASGVVFVNADLSNVRSFANADLRFAVFKNAIMPPASLMAGTDLSGAVFQGVQVPEKDWYEHVQGTHANKQTEYGYHREGKHWIMQRLRDEATDGPSKQQLHCIEQRASDFGMTSKGSQ